MTEQQEPLSDFWRKRRSDILEEELVNVLNGARGYAGFFGSDFSVDWGKAKSSNVEPSAKRIELDYSPLKDKTLPYDGQDMDIVMGAAIHECGHIKWSYPPERVKEYFVKKHHLIRGRGKYARVYLNYEQEQEASELHTIANVIEDFYVENKISETYPTLGAYLREARKLAVKSEIPHNLLYDLSTDTPSYDSLVTMWGAIALIDKTIPDSASNTTKRLLNKLINYTIQTAGAKPDKRLKISYQIWDELKALDRARQKEFQRQQKQHEQEKREQQGEDNGKDKKDTLREDTDEQTADTKQTDSGKGKETEEDKETETDTEKSRDMESEEPSDEPEETEQPTDRQQETEEETSKGTQTDTEPEGGDGSEELEEALDEPYFDHETLRRCYSINLDDKESMPKSLKDAVDTYQEKMPEDITQQVNKMLGGSGSSEITMELAGADLKTANKYFLETRRIAQKVSKLFIYDKRLRTRYRRGLLEGVVDPRRLYRAGAMDYKLFERREILAAPSLAVGVLVDVSGSMGNGKGSQLDSALRTAMALKTALSMVEGIDLMIAGYTSHSYKYNRHRTYIYRIYDRRTDSFRPAIEYQDATPSGHAMAGMVSQIGRYLIGKDKLIIHITDGAPDSHEMVAKAVDYCKEHKIDVMTLTLGWFSSEVIESYRGLCEHLDNIDKLPDAIASLLKKRLQKRMMRIR